MPTADATPINATPELTVTVTKQTLKRALAIGKITASKDTTLPMLNAVNIGLTERGNLVAQSSDRYIISRTHLHPLDPAEHNEDFATHGITVPLGTVNFLEKWLPLVDDKLPVTVAHNAKAGLSVSSTGAPTLSGLGTRDGDYPKFGKLTRPDEFVDVHEKDRSGSMIISPRLLNAIGRIASHANMRTDHVPLRPGNKDAGGNDMVFRVATGDTVWVDGIVMGVRYGDGGSLYQHGL